MNIDEYGRDFVISDSLISIFHLIANEYNTDDSMSIEHYIVGAVFRYMT